MVGSADASGIDSLHLVADYPASMPADVFVSYGREDRPHAERIASILEQRGWSVWWDRKLLAGEQYSQAIEKQIDQARCVVVLWSSSSVASSWVRDEAAEGTQRNILVPVLIDDVEIPLGFRQHHTVALPDPASGSNPAAFDDLVAAVDSVLRRSEPKTIPAQPREAAPAVLTKASTESRSGTVPRSYLYAAVGIAAMLALVVAWQSFRNVVAPVASAPATTGDPAPASNREAEPSTPAPAPSTPAAAPAASGADVSDSPADAAGVIVAGRSQDYYTVFDAAGTKQLGYVQTDKALDLFPGTYVVDLHGIKRSVSIAAGRRTSLRSGTISVAGTGKDYFAVFDAGGKTQLGYLQTNRLLELFPGEYQVTLHGVSTKAAVQGGRDTTVAAGRIVVPGSGSTYYAVLDAKGVTQLAYVLTNTEVELLPGTYTVDMNGTRRSAEVTAGGRTVVDR